jgi:uncharacterized protein YjbJ (UPF0337 family)
MQTEQLRGVLKIAAGKAKEFLGHLAHDGSLEARGKVEQLSGRAALACVRVRSGVKGVA